MKLDDFAISTLPRLDITAKTLYNYKGSYRRYLKPVLGEMDIREIGSSSIRSVLVELSPQSRYQAHMVLRTLFREALTEGLTNSNPMDVIKAPRVDPQPMKFLTWEQLKLIDFGSHTNRIRFLALHGLRYGEAAALRAEDIYDGLVHISRSIHGKTKSRAGVRNVPYLGYFEPFPKKQCRLALKLRQHGVTVHSLRKTYAYSLKSANVHVTTAAKLLGHSNPLITLKIYTGVLDDEIELSRQLLTNRLRLG